MLVTKLFIPKSDSSLIGVFYLTASNQAGIVVSKRIAVKFTVLPILLHSNSLLVTKSTSLGDIPAQIRDFDYGNSLMITSDIDTSSTGPVSYLLQKNGITVSKVDNTQSFHFLYSIPKLNNTYDGEYMLHVQNTAGVSTSTVLLFLQNQSPTIKCTNPVIQSLPSVTLLSCFLFTVSASPFVDINNIVCNKCTDKSCDTEIPTTRRNLTRIDGSESSLSATYSMKLPHSLTYKGYWKCTASNPIGQKSVQIQLDIIEKPDVQMALQNYSVSRVSDNDGTITISWQKNNNIASLNNYLNTTIIKPYRYSSSSGKFVEVSDKMTSLKSDIFTTDFKSLSVGDLYYFTIQTSNDVGVSDLLYTSEYIWVGEVSSVSVILNVMNKPSNNVYKRGEDIICNCSYNSWPYPSNSDVSLLIKGVKIVIGISSVCDSTKSPRQCIFTISSAVNAAHDGDYECKIEQTKGSDKVSSLSKPVNIKVELCSYGYYPDAKSDGCVLCPEGSFKNEVGDKSCSTRCSAPDLSILNMNDGDDAKYYSDNNCFACPR